MDNSDESNSGLVTSDSLTQGMTDGEKDELKTLFDSKTIEVDVRRIAVLSDIHSNMTAFNAVINDLKSQSFDLVINLGDLVGYYTQPNEVVERASELFDFGVMGNHDFAAIEPEDLMYSTLNSAAKYALSHNKQLISQRNKSYLATQPMKLFIKTPYGTITAVHGDPLTIFGYIYGKNPVEMEQEIRKALSHTESKFLFVGHTHIQGMYRSNTNQIYLNPGAVGQPRDGDPRAAYALIDLETLDIDLRRIPYDIDQVVDQVHNCQFPEYLGNRLEKGE